MRTPKREWKTVTLTDDECTRLSQKPGTKAQLAKSNLTNWPNGFDVYVNGRYVGTISGGGRR